MAAPSPPSAVVELGVVRLTPERLMVCWRKSAESDVARYLVFRGETPDFNPTDLPIGTVAPNGYQTEYFKDIGLKPGHSVRSVGECLHLANQELHVRNAATEARLLLGNSELFHHLQQDLLTRVFRNPRANRRFFKAMRAEFLQRREKHGPVVGMLEPNLKEGAGGLRDLHTVTWVGLARYGARGLDGLLSDPRKFNDQLQEIIDAQTDPCGVKVSMVEVKHVDLPPDMQRAMARPAEASRDNPGTSLHSAAQLQAS